MRFSTLALAGTFVLAAGAAQADDPMSNTYANTVTTKSAKDGATGTLLFNADRLLQRQCDRGGRQADLLSRQVDAEGRRGHDLPCADAAQAAADKLFAARQARGRRQLERDQRPGRDLRGLADRGTVIL